MCTRMIRIRNKSRTYRPLVSKYYLDVPCGKCPECVQNAQDDWFLRLWQEIETYNSIGGKCVFVTQTYRPACVPKYYYKGEDGYKHYFKCFSKDDFDKFINSMSKHFEREGLTHDTTRSGLGLKYMACCEYGQDSRFTHAPHLHTILFFPPEYCDEFKCKTHWQNFIQKYWNFGWCRWSKESDGGIFVTREFAGRYVSKYCTKQIEFFDQPEVNEFLLDKNGKVDKQKYDKVKSVLPRHWQSQSFGIGLCDKFSTNKQLHDGLDFNFIADQRRGKKKVYKAPRYIIRKLLYYTDENGTLKLNDRGIAYNRDYVSDDLNESFDKLTNYFSYDYKNKNFLEFDFYRNISKKYKYDFKVWSDVKFFLDSALDGRSVEDFLLYKKFIKDKCIYASDRFCFPKQMYQIEYGVGYRGIYEWLYSYSLVSSTGFDEFFPDGFTNEKKFKPENFIFLENFSRFRNFSLILSVIEDVRDYVSQKVSTSYDIMKKRQKEFKLHIS